MGDIWVRSMSADRDQRRRFNSPRSKESFFFQGCFMTNDAINIINMSTRVRHYQIPKDT